MIVGSARIRLHARWVGSLKEKRMIEKGLIAKTRNRFNVSIAEVDEQDTCQTIVLGVVWVTGTMRNSDSVIDQVITFIENNTEAEIVEISREIR